MASRKQSQDLIFISSLFAAMILVLTAMLFCGAASAQTVTFTYKLTCDCRQPRLSELKPESCWPGW
jgi:hypothetical protein